MAMFPAPNRSRPSGSVARASSSGMSLYSMTCTFPPARQKLPSFSIGSRLGSALADISARRGRVEAHEHRVQACTSGLSTWK